MRLRRALSSALLAALALTACGSQAAPHPAPLPPAPQLRPAEAGAIARQSWQATSVLALQVPDDPSRWRDFEEGTSLEASTFYAKIQQEQHRPDLEGSRPLRSLTTWVPRVDRYPRWFVAKADTTDSDNDGNLTDQQITQLDVYTQTGPDARWKITFTVTLPGNTPVPDPAVDSEGLASTRATGLARDPGQMPQGYATYLSSHGQQNGDWFAPGPVTSDQLPLQGSSDRFQAGSYPRFELALPGGSALGLFGITWLIQMAGSGQCIKQSSDRSQYPAYIPPGSWSDVGVTALFTRVAVIPPAGPDARVTLLGRSESAAVLAVDTRAARGSC
jgi:hypothetical protein